MGGLTRREQLAREERIVLERNAKAKGINDYWKEFTKYFIPWLHELTRQYKERGEFPLMGCWLLPSYYDKPTDIEVAAIASMLVCDTCRVIERVSAFRELIGEHPLDWMRSRGFVRLGFGERHGRTTGDVENWNVAEYFNLFYEQWAERERKFPDILLEYFGCPRAPIKERLLRMVLGTSDGFGKGIWSVGDTDLKCPLTKDVLSLLRTFYPDYLMNRDRDNIVRQFGFDRDCDLFYAALAYKELCGRNPSGCLRLERLFNKRYRECNILKAKYWSGTDAILPEISLE